MAGGALAIDCSARNLGWAMRDGESLEYGLVLLPGMGLLGRLYAGVRNSLEQLVKEFRPARLIWCRAKFDTRQTTAQALGGVSAIAELVCYDHAIAPVYSTDSQARAAVLGRGAFGLRDPARGNRVIKGTGTKLAKAAVMAWCATQGYQPASHDVGDALVLVEWWRRRAS